MRCRHCGEHLEHVFVDLGFSPPSNAYRTKSDLESPEKYFPLKLYVCHVCWLVQTMDYAGSEELFRDDYAYLSSTSRSWLTHAERYCADITARLGLSKSSFVVEVASNDGYLLRNFVGAGIPCLGIEPTASTAAVAERIGVPVRREFFGKALGDRLAAEHKRADLIVANNVLAHVPDINDFVRGLAAALKPGGTITLEFPHLMQLIAGRQFDTVYHEHFSYLSLYSVCRILGEARLRVVDVVPLSTHGGSLRVFGAHAEDARAEAPSVRALLAEEERYGLRELRAYENFQRSAEHIAEDFVSFLIAEKRLGKNIAAYGAAAKGNTLLNFAGVRSNLLPYVCDAATTKQGKFMPGSHIPILRPEVIIDRRPDWVVILPWNIKDEVMEVLGSIRAWGGRFVTAIPALTFH